MTDTQKKSLLVFFMAVAAVNLALGFSDGLFSNYFKDVYSVDAFHRGLIEFPRELPGVIVFFLISGIAFFGDITIAIVFGVQKQVMLVFGPWVLIDTLGQQVDTIVLLGIIASLLGMFFMPQLGKWIDRFGVKKLLYVDALSFIAVYLCYGVLAQFFNADLLAKVRLPLVLTCALFVVDRLSSQMGIIRTIYLKSIAVNVADVTPTLSLAMMLDHVVSIAVGVTGGLIWITIGSQYIFYTVAAPLSGQSCRGNRRQGAAQSKVCCRRRCSRFGCC